MSYQVDIFDIVALDSIDSFAVSGKSDLMVSYAITYDNGRVSYDSMKLSNGYYTSTEEVEEAIKEIIDEQLKEAY